MPDRSDKWAGGYKRTDKKGLVTYVIYKKVQGQLFEISTRCRDERAAFKQLSRFETDPLNYQPLGVGKSPGLPMSKDLIIEFLEWSRDAKKNGKRHVLQQQADLAWWLGILGGKDLKKLELGTDVLPALKDAPGRRLKIVSIKSFFGWLRKEKHVVKAHEDATFGSLVAPKTRVAQRTSPKYIPLETHERWIQAVAPAVAAHLELLAGTGWHITEVCRFAEEGTIEGNVLQVYHEKKDDWHRTEVTPRVLMAAEWLKGHGGLNPNYVTIAARKKAVELGLNVCPGWYRHTVSRVAIQEGGASISQVADFLGHDAKTNKTHYSTLVTPRKVKTLV